jgi:hypothetical protein
MPIFRHGRAITPPTGFAALPASDVPVVETRRIILEEGLEKSIAPADAQVVVAIVVTYRRKAMLQRCVQALLT